MTSLLLPANCYLTADLLTAGNGRKKFFLTNLKYDLIKLVLHRINLTPDGDSICKALTLFYAGYLTNAVYFGRRGKMYSYLTPNGSHGNTKFGMWLGAYQKLLEKLTLS